MIPLTGNQYQIEAGPYRATVTGLGAGLRELSHHGEALIAGHQPDELPPAATGQLLAPWPNRVDHGVYAFAGEQHQLAVTEPTRDTAIHGLTRWLPWTPVRQDPAAVTLRSEPHGHQGYPFCLQIDAEYRLGSSSGLQVTITARNLGGRPAPYGNGAHPYLTVHTPQIDECELTLPAGQWLPLTERGIPSGPPAPVDGTDYDFRQSRAIGSTVLDSALTGLVRDADAVAWAHLAADGHRVSLWAGPGYEWLQVFTADALEPDRRRKAVAIEPMTCPPNAFVTGHDLLTLAPGEEVSHRWGITSDC